MLIVSNTNCTIVTTKSYVLPSVNLTFSVALKQIKPYGKIVYEYNPFRNFRLTSGELTDLDTSEFEFNLNNPVNITPQYSYDGSVNLILNDNKNIPRLINSRFSVLEGNTYKIVDRTGSNDTNIYDTGNQFDIDTSLYKKIVSIPKIKFNGLKLGGNLKVGNYVFYFKYSDADGNETDFVGESGIVSVHIGNLKDPFSIRGGIEDENGSKSVQFTLENVDTSYDYVKVYYTRSTSESNEELTTAIKIEKNYLVKNGKATVIINGYELYSDVSLDDINITYNLVDSVKSQTVCQNRLFLANVKNPEIPYSELSDLALRFYPFVTTTNIGNVDQNYSDSTKLYEYYNTENIYNNLSLWNKEMYSIGVVFLLPNNSLSPVFNIRGRDELKGFSTSISEFYKDIPVYDNGNRVYININESDYTISTNTTISEVTNPSQLENGKGVIRINYTDNTNYTALGLKIVAKEEVITELKKYVKGFFFVRQKRIPTILCQGLTIGVDRESYLPAVPIDRTIVTSIKNSSTGSTKRTTYLNEVLNKNSSSYYMLERFLDDDRNITHDFENRLYFESQSEILTKGLICPEAELNSPYFSQLFTGNELNVSESLIQPINRFFNSNGLDFRNLYVSGYSKNVNSTDTLYPAKLTLVTDGMPMITDGTQSFSAKAGESEDTKFKYVYRENKIDKATNLIRGLWGTYVGINGYANLFKIIDIHIPGYDSTKIKDYFQIRYNDRSSFYPIGDRIDIQELNGDFSESYYRGDCFISNFTHRMNRNFQDIESPNNDLIVESDTWSDNYDVDDSTKRAKINRADLNAVELGHWITFKLCSNVNLSFRNVDHSYPSEESLTGLPRNFYPLYSQSTAGNFKIPESQVINTGLNSTTSDKYNYEVPDVPYIKNEFQTRILYSDISINDAFKNGFRTFESVNYRDYPKTYGSITKLIELYGNLLCIFEHGIALIPVNERTLTGEGSGGNVFINTSNVLPMNPKMLSDTHGTQWPDSVIKTPSYVYGIDTVSKKIWRTNGETFDIISEFKVQQFLNNNISLSERELTPIIGIRNVKTHYNSFKKDVMFTFYDNLYGFEEKAWNLCYNEYLQKWVTFYSWIPSFSENIDNIPFSFDRNTSKYIAKLGVSNKNSTNADGIILSKTVFSSLSMQAELGIVNRSLPNSFGTQLPLINYVYSIERDNFGNYKKFQVVKENGIWLLKFTGTYTELSSKVTWLLNIKVDISISEYNGTDTNIKQYVDNWSNYTTTNYGYYQNVVAVTSEEVINNTTDFSKPNLLTDFWKHGQGGIIDIKEKIKPTKWFGVQHPFEFEVVVSENSLAHKVFENLQISSNKTKPESLHFEIVGEVYDFARDKLNMYFRQEAMKSLYQYNGSDILYNSNYLDLTPTQIDLVDTNYKARSYMFPLYYSRVDTFNEIQDTYQALTSLGKDYQNLSGSEIVYDNLLNQFSIATHIKATDIKEVGRLRGNCQYCEDKWEVQIPSIITKQKNELEWIYPPINLVNSPVPKDVTNLAISSVNDIPNELVKLGYDANLTSFDIDTWNYQKETKIRDKFCKIKIRYDGSNLAIINALKTIYNLSYA